MKTYIAALHFLIVLLALYFLLLVFALPYTHSLRQHYKAKGQHVKYQNN